MLGEPREALIEADPAPGRAIGHLVAGGDRVPAPQLDRVEAEAAGHLVEDLFDGEGGLRRAGRAVGAGADAVRLDPVGDDLVGIPAVRADGQDRGDALDAALREGAGLERQARPEAEQVAVARGTSGQLDDPGGRRVAHPEVLVAGQLDPDRAPEQERGRGRQRIGDEQLAAEAATERRAGHAHPGDRQPEEARQLGARPERALRGARQVQDAVAIELGHRDLRLDVALVDPARREATLDDDIAGRKGRVDIAAAVPVPSRDIGRHVLVGLEGLGAAADRGVLRFGGAPGAVDLPVDPGQRSAGRERLFDVDDGRERARFDVDELGAVGGRLGRLGDDQRDRLAGPHDLVPGERLEDPIAALGGDRQVGGDEDGDDARAPPVPPRGRCVRCGRGPAVRALAERGGGRARRGRRRSGRSP